MHRFNIQPGNIETINATRYNTNWKPRMATKIISDADDAITDMEQDHPDVKIFTDGSGMEGKIGAAAVLYRNNQLKSTLRYNLGSQKHHTVYEGEGAGILLGAKLLEREWGTHAAIFYTDNRAAILATQLKPQTRFRSPYFRRPTQTDRKHDERKPQLTNHPQMDPRPQRSGRERKG
jgi:hypothetical protein